MKLFTIEAEIELTERGGRTQPAMTGYRPGFRFIDHQQTSGSIKLLHTQVLHLGVTTLVEISLFSDELLGAIEPGVEFNFFEGPVRVGSGKVLKVLGWKE